MERYFVGTSITDEKAKVRTDTLYLTDTATLWWRRKHNDIKKGLCTIDTWDVFKKEIKRQFYPENVTYEARKKLRELKHKNSISDYDVVTEEPILALPNHTKVFELQTDASDFAIGGVLMQERHPIAFESRKLNDTEWRYTVQDKEMIVVVHFLRTWRHYLLGSWSLIKTDNIATFNLKGS
ncbi:hypothetical protein RJ639_013344 [Escallonia herrerae]|uniref:Reverse transcriptase/retrotransposon-derived protein RNase H-like domain-containing protein n=1 Tax=Escallonia herrerae TaxID=1293975 RepID=A0AA88VJN9_9ASTE|nr:hypothetical protein RJ639_013344 [Escallonia herrerae]